MSRSPDFKIFTPAGHYIASAKYGEDAAMIVALYGPGARVKYRHAVTVWTEGEEDFPAGESYDHAGDLMRERVAAWRAEPRPHSMASKDPTP